MGLESRCKAFRERDPAVAPALGCSHDAPPRRLANGQRCRDEIEIAPCESDRLALTQAGFGPDEKECPAFWVVFHRLQQPFELLEREEVELRRLELQELDL